MKLHVLGSSSSGNGYALISDDGEIFLIEAGIKTKEMLKGIDYKVSAVSGCIISHCHLDHALYATPYSKLGIRIGCNQDMASKKTALQYPNILEQGKTYAFGSFRVTPFEVKHDVPNFGYLIHHKEMGTMLFATDTYTLPFEFRNINHFLLEANYSDEILCENIRKGTIDERQRKRLMVSHMSLKNCILNLTRCHAEKSRNIVLIHLSSRNSHAARFKNSIASHFAVPTYIAEKNKTITL